MTSSTPTELESWNMLAMTQEVHISRRTALATLAFVSTTILKKVVLGSTAPVVLNEFFSQTTVSIASCDRLLKGNGLGIVEQTLPTYLPILETLAKQPSQHQAAAARLVSLASRIAARLAFLRNQPQRAESYYRNSLTFARISQDPDVHVAAIKRLAGHVIEDERRAQEAYDIYQQALPIVSNPDTIVDPRLQGLIYVEVGASQMYITGKSNRDVEAYIDQAKNLFAEHTNQSADLIHYQDTGDYMLYQREALGYMVAGDLEAAKKAFEQIDNIDPEKFSAPKQVRINNLRARLALKMGDLEAFERFSKAAIEGAEALGSEGYRQQAIANWRLAKQTYPNEQRIRDLADRLLS